MCYIFVFMLFCATVGPATAASNIALDWAAFERTLKIASSTVGSFNMLRRGASAYRLDNVMDWCMYNTWAIISDDTKAIPMIDIGITKVRGHASASDIDKAISYAVYRCLKHEFRNYDPYFGQQIDIFFTTTLGYDHTYTSKTLSTPAGVGNFVASKILKYTDKDGLNADGSHPSGNGGFYDDYTGYYPVNDPMPYIGRTDCSKLRKLDHYQPATTRAGGSGGGLMQSGAPFVDAVLTKYRTWGLEALGQFMPPAPPRNESNSHKEFADIHWDLVNTSAHLTDRQKSLASVFSSFFFQHRTFATNVIHALNLDLENSIKIFIAQSQSSLEAFAAQHFAKRFYDFARTTTPIQCLFANQIAKSWKGPYQGIGYINLSNWTAYLPDTHVNNNGPEYPCGHCVMIETFSEVMRNYFRRDTFYGVDIVVPEGGSWIEPKITNTSHPNYIQNVTDIPNTGPETIGYAPATEIILHWDTWTQFSIETSLSREYLGVHNRYSTSEGLVYGRKIGKEVWKKLEKVFSGKNPN